MMMNVSQKMTTKSKKHLQKTAKLCLDGHIACNYFGASQNSNEYALNCTSTKSRSAYQSIIKVWQPVKMLTVSANSYVSKHKCIQKEKNEKNKNKWQKANLNTASSEACCPNSMFSLRFQSNALITRILTESSVSITNLN